MNHKNLIPAKRLQSNRTRRSIRKWVVANGLYSAGLVLAAILFRPGSTIEGSGPASAVALRSETTKATYTLATLRTQAAHLKLTLDSGEQISQSPDWSILLCLLGKSLGDQVVLNRIDCMGERGSRQAASFSLGRVPEAFSISGMGGSQQAVTEFVLKLEELHLFTQVKLIRTSTVAFAGYQAIGFELQCDLSVAEVKP